MRAGNRQTERRSEHDDNGGGQLGGESRCRAHLGEMGADGGNHFAANEPQPRYQRDAEGCHGDGRHRDGTVADGLILQHVNDGGKRADGVGDVVRAVAEGEAAGGEHLQPAEHDEGGAVEVGAGFQGAGVGKRAHPQYRTHHADD